MSAFVDALKATLECPHCHVRNEPGLPYVIDLDRAGHAYCLKCLSHWIETLLVRSPK